VMSSFRELRRVLVLAMIAGIVLLAFRVSPRAQTTSVKAQSAASAQNAPTKPLLVPRSEYVGDEACVHCHEDKAESYDKTAHHLTSQLANKKAILGTFGPGENIMRTSNADLHFRMEAKDDKFFETAVWGTPPNEKTRTHSLDLVIGSGQQGQSYLYWDDDQLFGLPVGYSTIMQRWINGPGYVDGTAKFDRGIIPRCLECHAAYFESKFPSADCNVYNLANFVLGISCERCHGRAGAGAWRGSKGHAGGRKSDRQSCKAFEPASRRDLRTVPRRARGPGGSAGVLLRAGRAAGELHQSGRFEQGRGRARAAGQAAGEEQMFSGVSGHDLLDVPRYPQAGAGPGRAFTMLSTVSQGGNDGDPQQSGRRAYKQLRGLPHAGAGVEGGLARH